jgi:antitoxin (DNA-binding transcriptional repressor) of toxin-antitoxin stability system
MKIESLREVKAKLSKIVKELPSEKFVVIKKNGRPCAVLFPVTEETDLESLLLASEKILGNCWTARTKEGEKKGFTRLQDLPERRTSAR